MSISSAWMLKHGVAPTGAVSERELFRSYAAGLMQARAFGDDPEITVKTMRDFARPGPKGETQYGPETPGEDSFDGRDRPSPLRWNRYHGKPPGLEEFDPSALKPSSKPGKAGKAPAPQQPRTEPPRYSSPPDYIDTGELPESYDEEFPDQPPQRER